MTQLIERHTQIDGIGPWIWLEQDTGTWDGPMENWPHLKLMWQKYIKNYRVCIQAGGALGMYPRLLAEMFQRVVTFEPDPISFSVLEKNIKAKDNITAYNCALGSRHGMAFLDMSITDNVGMHQIRNERNGEGNVTMATLDSLNIPNVDFIQLDVEQYEHFVLLGAENTVDRCRPVISCERPTNEVRSFMDQHNYKEVESACMDTTFVSM